MRVAIRLRSAAGVALGLAILVVLTLVAASPAPAQTFKSLYSFGNSPDGATPFGGVVKDKLGNLYGTTSVGGASGFGTVYKLSKSGEETVLYSFSGGADGSVPYAGLVMDTSGNLYGTTIAGGSSGAGTVFEVNSGTKQETVLHSFKGQPDGGTPFSGLIMDKSGNLYGATFAGGSFNDGTVYKVNIQTQQETVLYSFAGDPDGGEPVYGNLLMDKSGNLYGTTQGGGSFNGVVFKVNITTKRETVMYTFNALKNGEIPTAGLVRDSTGNLYGTTAGGGNRAFGGTVFKLTGTKETVLHRFHGTDGQNPFRSPLMLDQDGTLYGVTYLGGAKGYGTVFSVKP